MFILGSMYILCKQKSLREIIKSLHYVTVEAEQSQGLQWLHRHVHRKGLEKASGAHVREKTTLGSLNRKEAEVLKRLDLLSKP